MPSGYGYGAAEGLQDVIARRVQEQLLKQRQAEMLAEQAMRTRGLDLQESGLGQRAYEFETGRSDEHAAAEAARLKDEERKAALAPLITQYTEAVSGGAPPEMVTTYRDQLANLDYRTTEPQKAVKARLVPIDTVQGGRPVRTFRREDTIAEGESFPVYQAPQRGPEPEYEWVVRGGQPLQIRKGTARPGDAPYRAAAPERTDTEWVIRNGEPQQIPKGTAQPGDRPYAASAMPEPPDLPTRIFNKLTGEGTPKPIPAHGPAVGEERVINGVRARWDGKGWLPVGGE